MRVLSIFFAFVIVVAARGDFTPGLAATFGSFFKAPITLSDAVAQKWTKAGRPVGTLKNLEMYCAVSRQFCVFFDDNGFAAGVQVALRKDTYSNGMLDFKTQGFKNWTFEGISYYTKHVYFVNKKYLSRSRKERRASYDNTTLLQLGVAWLSGFNDELVKVPGTDKAIETVGFNRTICFPGMGDHEYYHIEEQACTADKLFPWGVLVKKGRLIGCIFNFFGALAVDPRQDFFEKPLPGNRELFFPGAPVCPALVASGQISMHIWFIEGPEALTCP